MTIPRLELNGALIAARLCSYNVPEASTQVQNLKDHLLNRQLSCSSLDWRPFCSVQTRRSEPAQRDQQSVTEPQCWRYCPSDDNPADLPSGASLQLSLYLAITDGTDIHSQPECQWPLDLKTT